MSYPGQPESATVTFKDASGTLTDPSKIVFTLTGPGSVGSTIYRYGTDAAATRTSLGTYALAFTPTRGGDWYVTADAFDDTGRNIEATQAKVTVSNRVAPIPTP